jgi:hypothetical protein
LTAASAASPASPDDNPGDAGDALFEVAHGVGEQRRHRRRRRVGRAAHGLRLADRVLGVVEDPVDSARQGEQILGVQRGDERIAQRVAQFALGVVGLVLDGVHDG